MSRVKKIIKTIEPHDSKERFEGMGVSVIKGSAKFVDKNTISINNQNITAKNIVIATGSTAAIPPILGLDKVEYLTNENIFELQELPDKLIVLGGGPIGLELGQGFRQLGSEAHQELEYYSEEKLEDNIFRQKWFRKVDGQLVLGDTFYVDIDAGNGNIIRWEQTLFLYRTGHFNKVKTPEFGTKTAARLGKEQLGAIPEAAIILVYYEDKNAYMYKTIDNNLVLMLLIFICL